MLRIGIVAGESSGDILGAGLLNAIQSRVTKLVIEGIGGNKMLQTGMRSLYPIEKLSVMGLTEIISGYSELNAMRKNLRQHFITNPPDVFIGIDAPDFNLWLEKELKTAGIKTVHYVSPSVWAWRSYRIKKIFKSVDLILNLFPFETDLYNQYKVPNQFVGHPLADELMGTNQMQASREELGLPQDKKIVTILSGSRLIEINRMAAPLLIAADWASKKYPNIHFISSFINDITYERFNEIQKKVVPDLNIDKYIDKTHRVIDAADIIMLVSGTATLEAMLLQKPMIVVYRLSWITYWIVRLLAKIPYAALPNILAGKMIVPECLQADCNPKRLFTELQKMIEAKSELNTIKEEFSRLSLQLKKNANENAANAILCLIKGNKFV